MDPVRSVFLCSVGIDLNIDIDIKRTTEEWIWFFRVEFGLGGSEEEGSEGSSTTWVDQGVEDHTGSAWPDPQNPAEDTKIRLSIPQP